MASRRSTVAPWRLSMRAPSSGAVTTTSSLPDGGDSAARASGAVPASSRAARLRRIVGISEGTSGPYTECYIVTQQG